MRLGADRKRQVVELAKRLHSALASDGVAKSSVTIVLRYLRTRPAVGALRAFLEALPRSALAKYTAGTGPQLERVARHATDTLNRLVGVVGEELAVEALAYVFGIVARQLTDGDARDGARDPRAAGRPPGRRR